MPTQKTLQALKGAICSYMTRTEASFILNGNNNLLTAINNAKDYCQRAINFEYAKTQIKVLQVSIANGGSLLNAVSFFDGVTSVDVKTLLRAYLPYSDGTGQVPVNIVSREQWASRLQRKAKDLTSLRLQEAQSNMTTLGYAIVLEGKNFYLQAAGSNAFNNLTAIDVFFDCLQWIPDFADAVTGTTTGTLSNNLQDAGKAFITLGVKAGMVVTNNVSGASATVVAVASQTVLTLSADIITTGQAYSIGTNINFLLDYCFDFLLFRSMYELNFFLKEDQRVSISKALLDEVWNNVVQWNATVVGSVVDVTLD